MTRWAEAAASGGFGVENLPFGVARLPGDRVRCVSRIGERVVDLAALSLPVPAAVFEAPALNGFLSLGRSAWRSVRDALRELLEGPDEPGLEAALWPLGDVRLLLPVEVGDYVDFYASIHHATNLGRMFRPGGEALLPNWRHLPVGYHGRSATVVASGTPVVRPNGQVVRGEGPPALRPTEALDLELEVGFVVGAGNGPGEPIPTGAVADHVAGLVLVNDWSARDIQAFEYQPLGPFLGKSFATSVSPWLVTLDALDPHRVPAPPQEPAPAPYLATDGDRAYDLHLEVLLQSGAMAAAGQDPVVLSRTGFADMYWTIPQMLAHATVNGARTRPGDLYASGTVSGPDPGTEGSLIELARRGERPVELPDGTTRSFLADGDTVILRGWAGGDGRPRIDLGEVRGTVHPARPLPATTPEV